MKDSTVSACAGCRARQTHIGVEQICSVAVQLARVAAAPLSRSFVTAVVSVNVAVEIAHYHRNKGSAYNACSTTALSTVYSTTPFRVACLARRSTATFATAVDSAWRRPA